MFGFGKKKEDEKKVEMAKMNLESAKPMAKDG
jgi:hypothetical protein